MTDVRSAADIRPRHFRWEMDGTVGLVTLDRPERKNPLTLESYRELTDTFLALQRVPDVRAVVITGAGGNFCSGGDVHEIIGPLVTMKNAGDHAGLLGFTQMTGDLVKAMRACPQPIVAAVDGICVGAGAILAMASDLRFGTARSKVAFLFVRVGLSGADMGAAWMLPRLVGLGRATELLMTGEFIDAKRAEAIGLYHRVVADGAALKEAQAFATKLAQGPGDALGVTKRSLDVEADFDLERALDHEARVQAKLMEHPDYREAYEAFRAKRAPRFA